MAEFPVTEICKCEIVMSTRTPTLVLMSSEKSPFGVKLHVL